MCATRRILVCPVLGPRPLFFNTATAYTSRHRQPVHSPQQASRGPLSGSYPGEDSLRNCYRLLPTPLTFHLCLQGFPYPRLGCPPSWGFPATRIFFGFSFLPSPFPFDKTPPHVARSYPPNNGTSFPAPHFARALVSSPLLYRYLSLPYSPFFFKMTAPASSFLRDASTSSGSSFCRSLPPESILFPPNPSICLFVYFLCSCPGRLFLFLQTGSFTSRSPSEEVYLHWLPSFFLPPCFFFILSSISLPNFPLLPSRISFL